MVKVLVWGTGKVASRIIKRIKNCELVGFVESEKSKTIFEGKMVFSPEEIPEEFDILLLAIGESLQDIIYNKCKKYNIDTRKLCVMHYPKQGNEVDIKSNQRMLELLFDKDFVQEINCKMGMIQEDWIECDKLKYEHLNRRETMQIKEEYYYPIYTDKFSDAGQINSYFWQDLWAARKIYKNAPKEHYDIGSRVDGFISHLLTFRDCVHLIDIRPLEHYVDGLFFTEADATNLEAFEDESIESISALCSLEHFGLGRYGDEIDPEACYKCFKAIEQKVQSGGHIYISVPVGKEHVEFNAHRVFFATTIIDAFCNCTLMEYSCTKDGMIEYNVSINKYDEDINWGGTRFGLFHFKKK